MTPPTTLGRPAETIAMPMQTPLAARDIPSAKPGSQPLALAQTESDPAPSANEHAQPLAQSRAQTPQSAKIAAKPKSATRTEGLPSANEVTSPTRCSRAEDRAAPSAEPPSQPTVVAQTGPSPFRTLRVWAEMFEDAQKARIAVENRALRGGLDPETYAPQLAAVAAAEHVIGLALRKTYRVVCPAEIRAWQKEQVGIGEHLLARLLGVIGHPRHTTVYHWETTNHDSRITNQASRVLVEDGPMERRVSDLWSYCGHGDSTRKRQKGMSAEDGAALGNPRAKTLVRLLAVACVKQGRGEYRAVYDTRRAVTQEGRPDWTPLRRHNDALRITGKAILKDLWIAGGAS